MSIWGTPASLGRLTQATFLVLCTALPLGCGGGDGSVSPAGDQDSDGITNADEGYELDTNTDGDTFPDWRDLDSDGDGVSDADEAGDTDPSTPPVDLDGNGTPDFQDPDYPVEGGPSQGDGGTNGGSLPDANDDTDGDGTPNGQDTDDDGDGIADTREDPGFRGLDSDGDGIPNRLDPDSDGDGVPDAIEGTHDTDDDGKPDFLDADSDGDGLGDDEEDRNGNGELDPCTEAPCESSRTDGDTDDDGVSDLVESVAGTDPNDKDNRIPEGDFYFVLPFEDPPQDAPLEFSTNLRRADVFFSVDTTGSFQEEINAIKSSIANVIVPQVRDAIPDPAFGVGGFEDFPTDPFGNSSDRPLQLLQAVTADAALVSSGVQALPKAEGGNDIPESGMEALFQWATGLGIPSLTDAEGSMAIPPFSPGEVGGAGFRQNALPVLIQITDARSHTPEDYAAKGITAHSRDETVKVLNAIGARVIGVRSLENEGDDGDPLAELSDLALSTGATVPPNDDGLCPTGLESKTRAPVMQDGAQVCPMVFDVRPNGDGLGLLIVSAIKKLAELGTLDISAATEGKATGELGEELPTGTDTAGFILSITPEPPPPDGASIDGEIFRNVTTGRTVNFRLQAQNTFVPHEQEVQLFTVDIHILGDEVTILDERTVYIVVPRKLPDIEVPLI